MAKVRRIHQAERAEPKTPWLTIKRIWSYLSSAKGLISFILFLVAINVLLRLIAPYLLGYTIDHFLI